MAGTMNPTLLALTFRVPGRLWLLLGVAALAGAYLFTSSRRRTYAVRFTNLALLDSVAPKRPGWRRHLPAGLLLLALSGMVGAFAQPARQQRVPRERATIIVAIDTSLSMQSTDVRPTRLRAAQSAATNFIDRLPPRLNVGLVSFNGVATLRVPPTQDREEVRTAIKQLRLGERTAIGEAIFASLDAIKAAPGANDAKPVPARIVLMSDGETTTGRPDAQAAAAAKKADVPVSTIAFGTADGVIQIPQQDQSVPVPVAPAKLALIAQETGGSTFTATTEGELKKVYENIGSSVGYTKVDKDQTGTFVGFSLIVLFIAAALSQLWFSRLP
jgi:Ca-activated chloride channel family protein